jgi:hypothetical protein
MGMRVRTGGANVRRAQIALIALTVATAGVVGLTVGQVGAITQSNGCFSPITSNWSTFGVPIVGTPSAGSVASGGTVTLANTKVTVVVDSAIIAAGVTAGVVNAGDNSVASTVKLTLRGTNTVETTQVVQGVGNVNFNVAIDGGTGAVTVTPNPVTATVNLGDSVWTSNGGGDISIAESATPPSNSTLPTIADRNAAPLQILNRVNNAINANFYCWPGTGGPSPAPLSLGSSSAIATVAVSAGSTTLPPATTTPPATTVPPATTTTVAGGTTTTAPTTTVSVSTGPPPTTTAPATTVPAGPVTKTVDYTTTCKNSVTPDQSSIPFTVKATAINRAALGSKVTVTGQRWTVTVPGSVLDTGINLGLLNPGDTINGKVEAVSSVGNATPGSVTASAIPIKVGPIQVDAVSGAAKPAAVSFDVPDTVVTATGGTLTVTLGVSKITVTIGALNVTFTCTPASGGPFAQVEVAGQGTVPATTSTVPKVASSGAKVPKTGSDDRQLMFSALLALALLQLGAVLWGGVRRQSRP